MRPKIITEKKERSSSRVRIYPRGYLVLTGKGFEFVEKWFHTEGRVPPHLARLYHLLLRMVSFRGVIQVICRFLHARADQERDKND